MGLLSTLIINVVIPTIPLHIYVSSSLRKHIVFMMTVMLKIFYETEKNIGTCNYLQMSKDSRKIPPCKNPHQENSRPSYSLLKNPPPPENFPPGIFPPISLIVFLHFFSLNTLSINGRRESAHVHPSWMKNFDINLL